MEHLNNINQQKIQTAAFGMGCFWGPEAFFGAEESVVRTRVGYAGGAKENPTYRDIGDHTETILIEFDLEKISYPELLELFWSNHHYRAKGGNNQYASRIFFTNKEQKRQAEKSKSTKERESKVGTEIQQLNFTVAENYHQKYRLRHSEMMNNFSKMAPDEFRDSPLTAKLNGYAAGYLDLKEIDYFDLEIDPDFKDRIIK